MKKKILRSLVVFAIGLGSLTLIRFVYEWFSPSYNSVSPQGGMDNFGLVQNEVSMTKRNFASYEVKKTSTTSINQSPQSASEQKYEKVAALTSYSDDFEKDAVNLRKNISNYQAVIQYEKNSGLKPNRSLYLQIGVYPQLFDKFLDDVRKIGHLSSIQIDKTDQTSEFKKLTAKKTSLENTRRSLLSLKNRGGSIEELMKLEEKLQSIEQEIQDLGVDLGDFSAENEFCTVRITLSEQRLVLKNPVKIVVSAFKWSLSVLLALAGILLLVSLTGLAVGALLVRLKWLPAWMIEKIKEKS